LPDFEVAKEFAHPPGKILFTVDAAFQRCAWARTGGDVAVKDLNTEQTLFTIPGDEDLEPYGGICLSPDGRALHRLGKYRASLWRLEGADPVCLLNDVHRGYAFSPDSSRLAVSDPDGLIRIVDTRSGHELRRYPLRADNARNRGLYWNPKRPELLVVTPTYLDLLNLDTGASAPVGLEVAKGFDWADWHPDGNRIAVSGGDLKIYLYDVRGRRLVAPPLAGPRSSALLVRFNHAGDRLLSNDWWNIWRLWDTRTGEQLLTMPAAGPEMLFSLNDEFVEADVPANANVRLFRFHSGAEFRKLSSGSISRLEGDAVALDADGRVLLINGPEGVSLVDIETERIVATLPMPNNLALGFEGDGAILTHGAAGVLRWPLTKAVASERRSYGPPKRLLGTATLDTHGRSADDRLLAAPFYNEGALLFDRASSLSWVVGPQEDVRYCSVSPDGRWLATGSHWLREGSGAKIWNTRDGGHIVDLPVGGSCIVQFSPDSKWLLTTSDTHQLWEVGTWKPGPTLPGHSGFGKAAFTSDSSIMAYADTLGVVRLVRLADGTELAQLTAPVRSRLYPEYFSSDGGTLFAHGAESADLYAFDLRAIRAQLAELGLDWDDKPLGPVSPHSNLPISVTMDMGTLAYAPGYTRKSWQRAIPLNSLRLALNPFDVEAALYRGFAYYHLGDWRSAAHDYALALALQPSLSWQFLGQDHAEQFNTLAWLWAGKGGGPGDSQSSLVLAQKAAALLPRNPSYRNTLGVVYYRTGRYREAIETLEKNVSEQGDYPIAFDLYVLAVCHQRLGNAEKARDCYARAEQWVAEHRKKVAPNWSSELSAFKAEADAAIK
jgi:WD40 repeat protein